MSVSDYLARYRAVRSDQRKAIDSGETMLFIDTKWPHHMHRSGYHLLCEDVGYKFSADTSILPARLSRLLSGLPGMVDFERRTVLRQVLLSGSFTNMHICDGDFCLWPVRPRRLADKLMISATYHQPVDVLEQRLAPDLAESVDLAIAVARCQIAVLGETFGEDNVRFLPHGIDTEYFVPDEKCKEKSLVISVGVHRRDFATLKAAADLIVANQTGTTVMLIGPSKHLPDGIDHSSLTVVRDASDDFLREAYQRASCQLLPLEESTANNAILEGMASGLPLVTTNLAGIRDYTDNTWCISCPSGDAKAHADAVLSIIGNDMKRASMSESARKCSLGFDWRRIREQFKGILDEVTLWKRQSSPRLR